MVTRQHVMKIIARNVRAERQKAGLSQHALAKRTGLSIRYISRLETSPQNIRVDKLCLIAKALGVEPRCLLESAGAKEHSMDLDIVHDLREAIRLLQSVLTRLS